LKNYGKTLNRESIKGSGSAAAEYIFDGKKLKKRSGQREGELDGTTITSWNGERLGVIEGESINDSKGKKVLEFDGKNVKDEAGKKIATIEEIREKVEGQPGIGMVALWYFFIWK
jgi:hypothetical protein